MNNNYQNRKETSAYWFNKSSDLRGAAAAATSRPTNLRMSQQYSYKLSVFSNLGRMK